MERIEPTAVQQVAVIGTGVIGAGWTAHFLRQGLDVVVYDPAPDAEAALRTKIAEVWPIMEQLGLMPEASPDRWRFANHVADAVAAAHFVQENAPERLAVKQTVLAEIDASTPPETVISSSTSGYAMTDMQILCWHHPERTVVSHPFNPPYLIPLVEVVGGKQTEPAVVDWTADFWTAMGKKPLKMTKELPGFIANRLQEAMWREALHMLHSGMATIEEIDAAITTGPGLRWAIMGPMLTFHLAGGAQGMAHMLDHFNPNEFDHWTFLSAPQITEELKSRIVAGCEAEADGRSIQQLEQERDIALVALLKALSHCRETGGA
ncbi:MAG: 3-hydroxybutyryl-CoA dehydrogenase [Candidatus Entotheonella factor]|uniref:3-hydroxybutyryl-CoA dehydrogenase n=1 Tax=Entotheonella factor TaxID=1429438 RepID=W4L6U6_ENTF1|nr:MAG: 3-hydroxybutyryl-CoA dehydrogenase [Candidatus Entotheonella factor]